MVEIVLWAVRCIAGWNIGKYYFDSKEENNLYHDIRTFKTGNRDIKLPGKTYEEDDSLKDLNEDYVFWLKIDGTEIDYPVVKRDNDYYLKHNFMKKKSRHGALFLEQKCNPDNDILLVYGHHMKDGSMFGGLKKYKESNYRNKHKIVSVETEETKKTYEVFAVALIDLCKDDYFRFNELPETYEEKKKYISRAEEVSLWHEDTNWNENSEFLILSTCDYGTKEQRLIVICKKTD